MLVQFQDCSDISNVFRFSGTTLPSTVGETYNITNNVDFEGYVTIVNYTSSGSLYDSTGTIFTMTDGCFGAYLALGPCSYDTFCLNTILPSLSGYSGNYTENGVFYNTKICYSGDGINYGVIFYTGDFWCLSDTLGGTCLLEGATPCYSECPDISSNLFNSGPCPSPTPLPVNCDILDFTAYFDCEYVPVPTPTPTIPCDDVYFDFTSSYLLPTPTPSGNLCAGNGISFSICNNTTSITPSPTPTTTTTPNYLNVGGSVTFEMLDKTFVCTSVKILVNCNTGEELYTSSNLVYNGNPVVIGVTMFVLIGGEYLCVVYTNDSLTISSNCTVDEILGIYGECGTCNPGPPASPSPTQTPTNTQTPTTTPTTTQTSTPTTTPTITTTQTSTPTHTPTQTPTNTNTPTTTRTPGGTPAPTTSQTPTKTQTPTITPTQTLTNTSTNTPTPSITPTKTLTPTITSTPTPTPNWVYVYESCSVITTSGGAAAKSFPRKTQVVQSLPVTFVTIVGNVFKDSSGICWIYMGRYETSYTNPNVNIITNSGNYFVGAPSTLYDTCVLCEKPVVNCGLKIGDSLEGGKIAYFFKPGDIGYVEGQCHGIICALNDLGLATWGCMGRNLPGAQGKLIGTGKQNTIDILKGCSEPNIAARLCDNYSVNYNGIILDDWFLPSQDELFQLCINKNILGGFATNNIIGTDTYWMSNESTTGTGNGQGSNVVYVIPFSETICNANYGGITKNMRARVRAIRYF